MPSRNRLRQLLDATAASGTNPTAEEVATLPVADGLDAERTREWRSRVLAAGEHVAQLRRDGAHGPARRVAADWAARLGDRLADNRPDPNMPDLSPAELAARIRNPMGA